MHILALEAYDGGSHAHFLDGLIAHSNHRFTRMGLPARKWKWRMRGSALYFAQELAELSDPVDLIFTSDMTAGADLRALLPNSLKDLPMVFYFHENQLTYPIPNESDRDYQYGFSNITSCLAADVVWFNSKYHLASFLEAVAALLKKMPDYVPRDVAEKIRNRASVIPLGLSPDLFGYPPPTADNHHPSEFNCPSTAVTLPPAVANTPPAVLWNHRWEYDKNPDDFFEMLMSLDRAGIDFRLIVAGENFRNSPPIFAAAKTVLADHIDHFGFVPSRDDYLALLARADIVVSTAVHEFFGLSVLEAITARCYPLLPNRLSYPELVPKSLHAAYLYRSQTEFREKLIGLLVEGVPPVDPLLCEKVRGLSWPRVINIYDQAFENILNEKRKVISPEAKKPGK